MEITFEYSDNVNQNERNHVKALFEFALERSKDLVQAVRNANMLLNHSPALSNLMITIDEDSFVPLLVVLRKSV